MTGDTGREKVVRVPVEMCRAEDVGTGVGIVASGGDGNDVSSLLHTASASSELDGTSWIGGEDVSECV